ncbi:DUF302 domain-containing protein [Halorubrum sp. DTA46]|uniref:DUF302 domain-containing protein n=1 Tax=Halorubrum sp. DTA46 TaxID=3402162 RepID=UPI003AAB213E
MRETDAESGETPAAATADEALHTTLDMPFDDAVPFVQIEHELADFETVRVTRLDQMIEGMLGHDDVERTALIVVCHPEIAFDAIDIDPTLAGMLPCTTLVYERAGDDQVHVHHVSATKAIRDLGCAPAGCGDAVDDLVAKTGALMTVVWENIEEHGHSQESG